MAKAAQFKGTGASAKPIKVVGMGSCGVDYLASVAAYPKPDEKLRTEQLEVQGGGNAANALTAAARLGLRPTLVTKIGGDGLGDGIIAELVRDGIDTAHVLRASGHPSPFTYIIVDRQGGTRTCIHTPGAALDPSEMAPERIAEILEGAALVYFDGRLAEAAILLAQAARAARIPVLVEAERLRPGLDDLLATADYVVTSAHFPQDWTGEAELADAVLVTAQRLPHARFIITTLGTRGSVFVERTPASAVGRPALASTSLHDVMQRLAEQLEDAVDDDGRADCVTRSGLPVRRGPVATTREPLALTFTPSRELSGTSVAARLAAERAAAMNADASNSTRYEMAGRTASTAAVTAATATMDDGPALHATVTLAGVARLPQGAVVDTTGAGDAFIGAVLYGLVAGVHRDHMLQLAGLVAAAKCTALGARPGLPSLEQLSPAVLGAE